MKTKILYIDPIYQPGHINFNQIYIDYLYKEGYSIDFFFINNYADGLHLKSVSKVYTIKSSLLKRRHNPVFNRILYLYTLLFLRCKVNIKAYDYLLFSSYEEISFFFSFYSNAYLINHVNLQGCHSRIKKFFISNIFKKNTPIVLNENCYSFMKEYFHCNHLILSKHGLLPPFERVKKSVKYSSVVYKYKYVIFSPSYNSADSCFISSLLESDSFRTYLQNQDILFVVRSRMKIDNDNILCISEYLSEDDYRFLFLKANIILIIYPKTFQYRVSGVLFECFSNNKMCLLYDIDSFKEYSVNFNYIPYFSDVEGLIEKIDMGLSYDNFRPLFNRLEDLKPSIHFNRVESECQNSTLSKS